MNLFGIGPFEVVLIVILALIFLGPEELPKAARMLGKVFYQIQHMTESYVEEFTRAMQQPLDEARPTLAQPLSGEAEHVQDNTGLRPPDAGSESTNAAPAAPATNTGIITDVQPE